MIKNYRRDIDGLRAFAVLAVVLYHAGVPGFSGGYLGVDVFFAISGFLIGAIILRELQDGAFSFFGFYERRIRRIVPALSVVVALSIPAGWFLLTANDFKDFSQSVVASVLSVSNILFWLESGYFGTSITLKPLIHTWSLGIEEQFYVLFPLFLYFIWRYTRENLLVIMIAVAVISLITADITSRINPTIGFYLLHTRAWELLLGGVFAYLSIYYPVKDSSQNKLLSNLGFLLVIVGILGFDEQTRHPSVLTAIPLIGTCLLLRYEVESGVLRFALINRVSVGVGLISYSLYLIHQPIFAYFQLYSLYKPSNIEYGGLIALSIFLAYLSYRFIERPFRSKTIVKDRFFWPTLILFSIVLIGFGIGGHLTQGYEARLDEREKAIQIGQRGTEPTIDGVQCHGRRPKSRCAIGTRNAAPNWAIVGDSHAGAFGKTVDLMLKRRGESGYQLTQGGCSYAIELRKDKVNCLQLNREVREIILSDDIENIVLAGRYVQSLIKEAFDNGEGGIELGTEGHHYYPGNYNSEAERTALILDSYVGSIEELINEGKRVFLIYPIPEVGWDVPRQIQKRYFRGITDPLTTSYARYLERSKSVIDAFNSIEDNPKLHRILPSEIFCDSILAGRCLTELDSKLIYFDYDHLTTFGTGLVLKELKSHLAPNSLTNN